MKKGSAIIIGLLIVSIAASITLGVGRVANLENASASAYAHGAIAYYAAESGIEEAFLRYRYDQNAEIPTVNWKTGDSKVYRSNLTNNSIDTGAGDMGIEKTALLDSALLLNQVYDLRIGSRGSSFGLPIADLSGTICADTSHANCLLRDESKKFKVDFSDKDNRDVDLMFIPNGGTAAGFGEDKCVLIEVKIVGKPAGGTLGERKIIFYNNSDAVCDSKNRSILTGMASGDGSSYYPYQLYNNSHYRVAGVKSKIWQTIDLLESELYIKPIGANIAFTLKKSNENIADQKFYGPTFNIESIGYFGGTSRKLQSNIDRQAGTLYDLFDYVVYKAN